MVNYEWSPWIEHDGLGCRVVGKYVHIILRCGLEKFVIAGEECRKLGVDPNSLYSAWVWSKNLMLPTEIVRYRVREPRVSEWLSSLIEEKELV